MAKVFISYRRDDARYPAKELYRALAPYVRNPKADIFLDIDSIPRGLDFVEFLDGKVAQCEILLALIGDDWLEARDASGARRLDSPDDFVRIEIAAALARGIPVVPVLLDGASMPPAEALPDPLKPLVRRQAGEIRLHTFDADVSRLVKGLPISLKGAAKPAPKTSPAPKPPKPAPAPRPESPEVQSRTPLLAGLAALVILVGALGTYTADPFGWRAVRSSRSPTDAVNTKTGAVTEMADAEISGAVGEATDGLVFDVATNSSAADDAVVEDAPAEGTPSEAPAPSPIGTPAERRAEIVKLQQALKAMNYYTSAVDGSAGAGTREAATALAENLGTPAPNLETATLLELRAFNKQAMEEETRFKAADKLNASSRALFKTNMCSSNDQSFALYFEWARSDLTNQAEAVIKQALSNATSRPDCKISRIDIDGHTDSSEHGGYVGYSAAAFSKKRADKTAAAMINQGAPSAKVDLRWFGKTKLAKVTADGYREPLNRRVEVKIWLESAASAEALKSLIYEPTDTKPSDLVAGSIYYATGFFGMARDAWSTACNGGEFHACSLLGEMIFEGRGGDANESEGVQLVRQGCSNGDDWGCDWLDSRGIARQ